MRNYQVNSQKKVKNSKITAVTWSKKEGEGERRYKDGYQPQKFLILMGQFNTCTIYILNFHSLHNI